MSGPVLTAFLVLFHLHISPEMMVWLLLLSCQIMSDSFAIPWTATHQASLSFILSQSLLKLMSIESMMPFNHLILCHPLLLLPSIFPSNRVFEGKVQLFLAGVASVTHIPCLHLRNIFDCPCCGHLFPSSEILFHLPEENFLGEVHYLPEKKGVCR